MATNTNISNSNTTTNNTVPISFPYFFLVPTPPGAYEFLYLFAAIGVAGFIINGFALIVIFCYTNIWQKTKFYLLVNQITVDFVSCLVLAVHYLTIYNGDPSQYVYNVRITNQALCSWWYSKAFLWSFINASNCNVILVTFERYMKILHPWTYDKLTTKVEVSRKT